MLRPSKRKTSPVKRAIKIHNVRIAEDNNLKHGVSFEEAATAFLDEDGLDGEDLEHSKREPRRVRLAKSGLGRVLLIADDKE